MIFEDIGDYISENPATLIGVLVGLVVGYIMIKGATSFNITGGEKMHLALFWKILTIIACGIGGGAIMHVQSNR